MSIATSRSAFYVNCKLFVDVDMMLGDSTDFDSFDASDIHPM